MVLRISTEEARRIGIRLSGAERRPATMPLVAPRRRAARAGMDPQAKLWRAVQDAIPGGVSEFENAVPGRRFRIDIAFPKARLAVEVDGYEFHGKHKKDFLRDRDKRNALALLGWTVLAYPAGRIHKEIDVILREIQTALSQAGACRCHPDPFE